MDNHGKQTQQMQNWAGGFGEDYTDRNALSLDEMEELYKSRYGLSRSRMNASFLETVDRKARILEVGSNIGNQLLCLQKMGFRNLYGIEVQRYAVEKSKSRTHAITILEASAFNIPFQSELFDLVFTSGVLIHIHPNDIQDVLREIHRCSRRYIWGFEYFSDCYTPTPYRDEKDMLWKGNFAQLFLDNFPEVKLIKEQRYPYLDCNNVDAMYLLEKNNG